MEIICDKCDSRYVIDDSKIPESGTVSVKCPKCSNKIVVGKDKGTKFREDKSSATKRDRSSRVKAETFTASEDQISDSMPDAMEFFDEGIKTALIYCPDFDARSEIEKHLKAVGYQYRHITNAVEAGHRYRYHHYDMIVLHQSGPEASKQLQELIDYINNLPISTRRKIVTVHILIGASQFDAMQAFLRAMDVVISPTELSNLPDIIKRLEGTKERSYRIFHETLNRVAEKGL